MPPGRFKIHEDALPYTDALRTMAHTGAGPWYPGPDNALLRLRAGTSRPIEKEDVPKLRAQVVRDIESIVDSSLEGDHRRRIQALFGIGPWRGEPLAARQEFIGAHYPSSGRRWEGYRKEPLDRDLLSMFILLLENIAFTEGDMRPNQDSDYEVIQYLVRAKIQARETIQRRVIRALHDNVSHCEIQTYRYGPTPEEVILVGPGSLTRHSEGDMHHGNSSGHSYFLQIEFPKPLMKGEEFEYTLLRRDLNPQPNLMAHLGWYDERHLTPRLPVHRATFEVEFAPDERPTGGIWAFEGLADWLVPGTIATGVPLEISGEGIARFSWRNPRLRRACGIAWEW